MKKFFLNNKSQLLLKRCVLISICSLFNAPQSIATFGPSLSITTQSPALPIAATQGSTSVVTPTVQPAPSNFQFLQEGTIQACCGMTGNGQCNSNPSYIPNGGINVYMKGGPTWNLGCSTSVPVSTATCPSGTSPTLITSIIDIYRSNSDLSTSDIPKDLAGFHLNQSSSSGPVALDGGNLNPTANGYFLQNFWNLYGDANDQTPTYESEPISFYYAIYCHT